MNISPLSLSQFEIDEISEKIRSNFNGVLGKYQLSKYPQYAYEKALKDFSSIDGLLPSDIEIALLWKWGHINKKNYPSKQKFLIREIIEKWKIFQLSGKYLEPLDTYNWWLQELNPNRFITVSFITHLIHHEKNIPIIDQHNFRAMNHFISEVRMNHKIKRKPSNWGDILDLCNFMQSVLPKSGAKKFSDLDKFLMMFGKHYVKH